MTSDAIRWYDQNVSDVSRRYESVAAIELFDLSLTHTGDPRFANPRLWCDKRTTNYTALIYGGIIFLHEKKPDLASLLSHSAILTGIAATLLLVFFQWELRKLRQRIEKVDNYSYVGEEKRAFDIKPDEDPFRRGWQILLTLISVCIAGAALVYFALNPRSRIAISCPLSGGEADMLGHAATSVALTHLQHRSAAQRPVGLPSPTQSRLVDTQIDFRGAY